MQKSIQKASAGGGQYMVVHFVDDRPTIECPWLAGWVVVSPAGFVLGEDGGILRDERVGGETHVDERNLAGLGDQLVHCT